MCFTSIHRAGISPTFAGRPPADGCLSGGHRRRRSLGRTPGVELGCAFQIADDIIDLVSPGDNRVSLSSTT